MGSSKSDLWIVPLLILKMSGKLFEHDATDGPIFRSLKSYFWFPKQLFSSVVCVVNIMKRIMIVRGNGPFI